MYILVFYIVALVAGNALAEDRDCGDNEYYTECTNPCPKGTQCFAPCIPGCLCKKGYTRKDGVCVEDKSTCNDDEVYTTCGSACPPSCMDHDDTCKACMTLCVPGCFCKPGTVRHPNGKCVKIKDCPPRECTGPNEYFDYCPPTCPHHQNCSVIWTKFNCTGHETPICCKPQCRCNDGYYRNDKGVCIPTDECIKPVQCGENETKIDCYNQCVDDHCPSKDAGPPIQCSPAARCQPGCRCAKGYSRRRGDRKCVLDKDCAMCGDNAHYDTCPPERCPPDMGCPTVCRPACVCDKGYEKNEAGECVESRPRLARSDCPENEVHDSCGSSCPPSCRNRDPGQNCLDVCVDGCFCKNGFLRNEAGVCVVPSDCFKCDNNSRFDPCATIRPCPPNIKCFPCQPGCVCIEDYVKDSDGRCRKEGEEYRECGTACPPTCGEPTPEFCTDQCVIGCFCKKGLFRDCKGNCVPYEKCPPLKCGRNETATDCIFDCPSGYCPESNEPIPQCRPAPCDTPRPGCLCKDGYKWRHQYDKECILEEDCPPPVICCENEHFEQCGTACPPTCKDIKPEFCTKQCVRGCFCDNGYVRNNKGHCILGDDCPKPVCPTNQTYAPCVFSCPTDFCRESNNPVPVCSPPYPCPPGCRCKTGYRKMRDESKDGFHCIHEEDCPPPVKCGKDEHFNTCGTACPPTCDDPKPQSCSKECVRGCFCIGDLVRNKEGVCVPRDQCPTVC